METVPCPICKSTKAKTVRTRADIVECLDCSLVYLRTRPSVADLEVQYQSYASNPGSHMKLPATFEQLATTGLRRNDIMSDIIAFSGAERREFLDIGSGYGAFLLNARDHGFTVMGIELCREMAQFATKWLGIPTDTRQLEQCPLEHGRFQVVSLCHSLEHLVNQSTALGCIHRILEPGGIICGIVPNFDSWASNNHRDAFEWLDPVMHMVHYTPVTLKKALWEHGFNMLKMYTATGDYKPALLPSGALLKKIEEEGHGEELRFFAQKL